MKILVLLLNLFVSAQSLAALSLPPPQDLMAQARKGRNELRAAIFQIEKNVLEFTEIVEIDPYMRLLPELQFLSEQFKLDEIYPRAVRRLGESMFNASRKWLDIRFMPLDTILYYCNYANVDLAFRYGESIAFVLESEKDQKRLMSSADKLDEIIKHFEQLLPQEPALLNTYKSIMSDIASRSLAKATLTETEIQFWVGKIRTATGFSNFLDLMNTKIMALKTDEVDLGHHYINRLIRLQARIDEFAHELPLYIITAPGDHLATLLNRMVLFQNDI